MPSTTKTKQQLTAEIRALRRKVKELEQAGRAHRESEERFRSIYEQSPVGIEIYDADGRLLEVNRECQTMFGIESIEEVLGFKLFKDPNVPADAKARLLKHEAVKYEAQFDFDLVKERNLYKTTKTGRCYLDTLITPLEDSHGQTNGYLMHVRDITERKQAEVALRKSEERFRTVAEFTYNWETWVDPQGRNLYVSPSCERFSGYSAKEFLDDPQLLRKITHPDDRDTVAAHYHQPLETPDGTTVDFRIINRSGAIHWISHACQPVISPDGEFLGRRGSNRDITIRKQIETQHEQLFKQLAGKNKDLEQIIHVSSHDLRSPLISIKGFSEVVIDAVNRLSAIVEGGELPAELQDELQQLLTDDIVKSLGYITAGTDKMDTLLSGLLRLSRLGQSALSIKPLDMNALLDVVVRSIQFQVESTGADVVIDELPSSLGDDVQINQLFTNLLDNALKYLDPQRPGRIEVTGRQKGNRVEYCVADNGIGIAPEELELVFTLFYRVDAKPTEGDGLGLTIIRKILERNNGNIALESEPGVGSRFFVNLPAGQ
ncbi:MAG: PAS domain S-box protein [Candidatus Neomarinimicrobiota bacterium]